MRTQERLEAGDCVSLLDISNAFNSVRRSDVLAFVPYDCASKPLIAAAHGHLSTLQIADRNSTPIVTDRGVVQGCPLAPMLFAIVMADVLLKASDRAAAIPADGDCLHAAAYLDDATVSSPLASRTASASSATSRRRPACAA